MDPFTLFVVSALIFVAGELLRPLPKTRDREAVPFSEARLPSTDPAKVVHVGWGRYKISGPHLMGVTEYNTIAIEREVKTLFKSKDVTIGFRYLVGMYLGTGTGVANVRQIIFGGELLWDIDADGFVSQSATAGDVISINLPDFLGGREAGGGFVGTIRFYRGDPNQVVDPYIAGFPDHVPTPAYRFTSYFVFQNTEIGESPNIQEFEFVLDREPVDYLGLGANLRIDGKDTDTEVNPMAIAAELLRDPNFGQAEPSTALNIPRLKAMGDTLAAENNGMSLKWVNEESTEKLFRTIQDQAQATIFKKIGTGLWEGRLIRADFDPDAIRVVDFSNIRELDHFARRNWPETSNQAIIDWQDRDLDRKPTPAIEHDYSNFQRIGRPRADRKSYPGVYSAPLAVQIASRAIKQLAFPFANGKFTGDRTFFDAEPGEPMKLVWPPLGIDALIIRATSVGYGSSTLGDMPVAFVEDFFSQALAQFTDLDASVGETVNGAPVAIAEFLAFEMPYYLEVLDPLVLPPVVAGANIVNKLGWMARPPQSNALQYRMWEEAIAGGPIEANELGEYTAVGELAGTLAESTADETTTQIQSVTLSQRMLEDGAASEAEIKTLGFGLAYIEDGTQEEWIGVTNIVNPGTGVYTLSIARGLIDTLPKSWAAGARVWFLSTGLASTSNVHGSADVISAQVENQTTKGVAPLSAVQDTTFTARSSKPYPAGNFEITDIIPTTAKYPTAPLAAGDITFDWEGRDKTTDGILFQDDAGTVESGFEFFLTIYDNTNPLVPVVLRRVGRGASGAPGTNEAVVLSGEQYVWSAANQAIDDPTELIGDILVELRTQGDTITFADTIFNREDVARDFNRTVVIPVAAAGYRAFVEGEAGLTAYWPFDEASTADPIVETVGGLVTTRVGNPASGSRPLIRDNGTFSILAPGDGDGVSELSVPDNVVFDFGDVWTIGFWVQCRPTGPTGFEPIFEQGRIAGNLSRVRCWLDSNLGIVRFGVADSGGTGAIVDFPTAADGQPHFIVVSNNTSGGSREMRGYMDGVLVDTPAPALADAANSERTFYFFGGDDPAWTGNYRGLLGHFQIYNVEKTPEQIRENYLQGVRRLPYVTLVEKALPDHWYRLNDYAEGSAAQDWGAATRVDGAQNATPSTRIAGPLASPQPSFGMSFNGTTEYVSLPSDITGSDNTGAVELWFKCGVQASTRALLGRNAGNSLWRVLMFTTGVIGLRFRDQSVGNNWAFDLTGAWDDDQWHHISFIQDGVAITAVIDGRPVSNGNGATLVLNGTWTGGEWFADDATISAGVWEIGRYNGGTYFDGELSEVKYFSDVVPTVAEVVGRYLAGIGGLRKASDVLLDEDLHHFFEIDDFANVVDIANNMNSVPGIWQNTGGNLQVADQIPLASDDDLESVWIPRDGNAAGAVWAEFNNRAFLESKGLQNFHDFGWFAQVAAIFVLNTNSTVMGNAPNASARSNLFVEMSMTAGIRSDKFLPGDTSLTQQGNDLAQPLSSYGYREERTSANGAADYDNGDRRFMFNLAEADYDVSSANSEPTKVEIYDGAGGNMDDAGIAAWPASTNDNSRNFGGLMSRLAFWDRPPSRFRLLLNTLRGNGYHEHPLYNLAHEPALYWRMDDENGATEVVDKSGNDNTGTVLQGGTGIAEFDEAGFRSRVWHQDKGLFRFVGIDDANFAGVETSTVPIDITTYPHTVAFYGFAPSSPGTFDRVNISFSTVASNNRLRIQVVGAGADSISLLMVNGGTSSSDTFASLYPTDDRPRHYAFVFNAANDVDVYQDGQLVKTVTTVAGPSFTPDLMSVGVEKYNSGSQTEFSGQVHDLAMFDKALTAGEVREIYAKALQPIFDQAVESLNPSSFHALDEYEVANTYRNRIRDGAGQIVQGVGAGAAQAQGGIVPNYLASAPNMAGGGINTNWLAYPVGPVARTFSVWVDANYLGTVFSMGANVNTQALIIDIDAAGDVNINIRGPGNARQHTGTFNTAGAKLLTVIFDGLLLTGTRVFQDNVELLAVPIPGNAVALATVPALPMHLGVDVTDQATAAGVARLSRASVYPINHTQTEVDKLYTGGTV